MWMTFIVPFEDSIRDISRDKCKCKESNCLKTNLEVAARSRTHSEDNSKDNNTYDIVYNRSTYNRLTYISLYLIKLLQCGNRNAHRRCRQNSSDEHRLIKFSRTPAVESPETECQNCSHYERDKNADSRNYRRFKTGLHKRLEICSDAGREHQKYDADF